MNAWPKPRWTSGPAVNRGVTTGPVQQGDLRELAAVLARAFDDDPIWTWLFPDPATRARRLPRMFTRFLRHAQRRGDTVRTTSTRDGVAIWRPPSGWRDTRWGQVRLALTMAPLFRGEVDRISVLGSVVESHHPDEPHWYLATLGTDPPAQGRGVGSALLGEQLHLCDARGIPAYLETETAANVAFYSRHGFEVREEADVPRGGPHMWFMWRDPRPPGN